MERVFGLAGSMELFFFDFVFSGKQKNLFLLSRESNMGKLFEKYFYKTDLVHLEFQRYLMHTLPWNNRLIGIQGARGGLKNDSSDLSTFNRNRSIAEAGQDSYEPSQFATCNCSR